MNIGEILWKILASLMIVESIIGLVVLFSVLRLFRFRKKTQNFVDGMRRKRKEQENLVNEQIRKILHEQFDNERGD